MELKKRSKASAGLLRSVLTGAAAGLALLVTVIVFTAWLISIGVIPAKAPAFVMSLLAGLSSFAGGRTAVTRFRGGTLPAGGLVGIVLCAVLILISLVTHSRISFPGPWFSTLALVLAGGCLASLSGRRKKKK